ncbi:Glycerophosphodiester phosphodiesterase GDPD1 [Abeliophyllum distichum]|uniref:glycerophosphodiester phosphodiesterase n=1 Tax=Abeliophyllum distichum TaxID=126358 RepID=A0ABD1SYC6_9LAMI
MLLKYPLSNPDFLKNSRIPILFSPSQHSVFRRSSTMALKAVHVSDVPNLDHVPENSSFSHYSTRFPKGAEVGRASFKAPKFLAVKENTILSFNAAGNFSVDFIEFDVQVTKDGCPIVFHDNFILSEENGTIYEKRVTELNLSEFLTYGPQRESGTVGKSLLRKTKDGKIVDWNVEADDSSCTLQEVFQKVNPSLGFNIELKFDDHIVYQEEYLINVLQAILQVVYENAKDRPIIFSSFQPDAALLVKKLQKTYPVFFLTNGGNEIFYDVRRNSLEEAINLCLEGGLQGIVSEVRAIFRNPGTVKKIKESKLSLLTYGKLNNVPEAVYMQHLMGVDGVIVDLVQEITEVVSNMVKPSEEELSWRRGSNSRTSKTSIFTNGIGIFA